MKEFINQIINDDCFNIFPLIDDESIDMILCDLPYGTTQCSWDTILPFDKLWKEYERIIKPNGAICLCGSEPFSSSLRMSNIKLFKYDWVWEKSRPNGFLNANKMPMKKHELISVFSIGKCRYNPQGLVRKIGQNKNTGIENVYGKVKKDWVQSVTYTNYPTSILRFNNITKPIHPTQKPVDLFEYLIRTYTKEHEIVMDNCIGSGTTAVAALNTNRKFIGIEKDLGYYNIAKERVKNAAIISISDLD